MTSEILDCVLELVARGEVVISDHEYDELAADGILVRDILTGATEGKVIEEYPHILPRALSAGLAAGLRGEAGPCCVGHPEPCGGTSGCRHRLQAGRQSVDNRFLKEEIMTGRRGTKFIHEGQYAAAVEIEWLESETGLSPYLSLQDAQKLDEVREALHRGDLQKAGQLARIYQLTPLQV